MSKLSFFALFLFVAMFVGCEKNIVDDIAIDSFSEENIELTVNRDFDSPLLSFRNSEHFAKVYLTIDSIGSLEGKIRNLPGYTSMSEKLEEFEDLKDGEKTNLVEAEIIDGELFYTEVILNEKFQLLLNENAQMIVGDSLYQYGQFIEFKVPLSEVSTDVSDLRKLHGVSERVYKDSPKGNSRQVLGECEVKWLSNKRKTVGRLETFIAHSLRTYTVKVTNYKKRLFGWKKQTAGEMAMVAGLRVFSNSGCTINHCGGPGLPPLICRNVSVTVLETDGITITWDFYLPAYAINNCLNWSLYDFFGTFSAHEHSCTLDL